MTESEGTCPACGGSGGGPFGPAGSAWDDEAYRCPACKGLGVVAVIGPATAMAANALAPLSKASKRQAPAPAAAQERATLARTRPATRARPAAAGLKKR